MFDKLIYFDKQLFVFLNALGAAPFDPFWLLITKQSLWIPFFLLLGFLLQRKIGWKNFGIGLLFITLILIFCNTTVEFCKTYFLRLRPCNDPEIKSIIRIIHQTPTYSFFSGHAANSLATMTFVYLILKKYYQYAFLIFLYPLVFAYSRIYLGVHFPSDILTGYFVGALFGIVFYKMYTIVLRKTNLQNSTNG